MIYNTLYMLYIYIVQTIYVYIYTHTDKEILSILEQTYFLFDCNNTELRKMGKMSKSLTYLQGVKKMFTKIRKENNFSECL